MNGDNLQLLFNIAIGFIGLLFGVIMNRIYLAIDGLKKTDEELSKEVKNLAVKLPTDYVHKQEFQHMIDALFTKLDRIEQKLDSKEDKSNKRL